VSLIIKICVIGIAPHRVVKLNVDTAISKNFSTLAVIARDDKGHILKAWAKEHPHCGPLQAEAIRSYGHLN
jgi:hypothetical protein